MNFEQNGSCDQKILLFKYVHQSLYNFISTLVMNHQTCPFCHTAEKVPEMTLALKQKDLEIKKRDEEITSLQSQVKRGINRYC